MPLTLEICKRRAEGCRLLVDGFYCGRKAAGLIGLRIFRNVEEARGTLVDEVHNEIITLPCRLAGYYYEHA